MKVSGELLTDNERLEVRNPFRESGGKRWDLHEMSLYAEKGHKAVAADAEAGAAFREGMESLREKGF